MGKRPGHSYRRFHTHVGKMVALSTVSMNNLGSFAPLETFLSVFSFYRARTFLLLLLHLLHLLLFVRVVLAGKNYRRREERENRGERKASFGKPVRCNEQRCTKRERERERRVQSCFYPQMELKFRLHEHRVDTL